MKITLKKNHTHAGKAYTAGSPIDVPLLDALWLKSADVVDDGIDAFRREVGKLDNKAQAAHADALDNAVAADAARKDAAKADPAPAPASSPVTTADPAPKS